MLSEASRVCSGGMYLVLLPALMSRSAKRRASDRFTGVFAQKYPATPGAMQQSGIKRQMDIAVMAPIVPGCSNQGRVAMQGTDEGKTRMSSFPATAASAAFLELPIMHAQHCRMSGRPSVAVRAVYSPPQRAAAAPRPVREVAMRQLSLPGEKTAQSDSSSSQGGGSGRTAQSPAMQRPQDWRQRRPSNGSTAGTDTMQFPADGAMVRSNGATATYAPAEAPWADRRRSNGSGAPSVEAAATVAAEVLSSAQTGEIMVAADFADGGIL